MLTKDFVSFEQLGPDVNISELLNPVDCSRQISSLGPAYSNSVFNPGDFLLTEATD